jgi:hypothetical protein
MLGVVDSKPVLGFCVFVYLFLWFRVVQHVAKAYRQANLRYKQP